MWNEGQGVGVSELGVGSQESGVGNSKRLLLGE